LLLCAHNPNTMTVTPSAAWMFPRPPADDGALIESLELWTSASDPRNVAVLIGPAERYVYL
jgi:hypothetical protein